MINKDELIKKISSELEHNNNVDFNYQINEISYKIKFLAKDEKSGINIPSILAIPLTKNINNQIVFESNNCEETDMQKIIEQGAETGIRLARLTADLPSPIIVPLIPSYENYPYLQQLSQKCFTLSKDDENYQIDEQIVKIIHKAKFIIEKEIGITIKDKIFLNGYSSSGVFAQRFALLHPEIVEMVCIGGASGSIPIPTKKLKYPLGTADYKSLIGRRFDIENYLKIKFRYYVAELETQNKSYTRFDDFGQPAPMHDMSYFDRSVPIEVGKEQRRLLGTDMFTRAKKTVKILQNLGIDIQHKIILGRSHNNSSGIGVNELGDKFIKDTYNNNITINNISDYKFSI